MIFYIVFDKKFTPILGLGIGSLSSPPLVGWLFMLNPMFVMYTVGTMVLLQSVAVGLMFGLFHADHD